MSNMMEIDSPLSSPTTETATTTATTTQIKIHPLAIIGISDHQTRITTGGSPLSIPSSSSTTESVTVTGSDTQNQTQRPIIGLLFGYQNGTTISIIDAEEIEYPSSYNQISNEQRNTIKTKIELHQKVFPKHEVVGWYRVDISGGAGGNGNGNDNGNGNTTEEEEEEVLPTETDLIINNRMREYSKSDSPLLFVLMDANEKNDEDNSSSSSSNTNSNSDSDSDSNSNEKDPKKKKNNTKNDHQGEDARDKLDRDEQLPLTIYEPMVTTTTTSGENGAVFVNLDFELETFEPERIAVEKVFKTQPKNTGGNIAVSTTTKSDSKLPPNPEDTDAVFFAAAATATATTATDKTTTSTQVQTQSASGTQIQSLITSIEAMNTRIAVLLDFLQRTQNGDIPPDHTLLRQVGSLVNQLPLVMGRGVFSSTCSSDDDNEEETKMKNDILVKEFENEYDDMLVLSFLATIAKTTKAVLSYSEKFKVINEARSNRLEMAKGR